jgi:hypothetical protein
MIQVDIYIAVRVTDQGFYTYMQLGSVFFPFNVRLAKCEGIQPPGSVKSTGRCLCQFQPE